MFFCFKSCARPDNVDGDNCCYLNSAVLSAFIPPNLDYGETIYVSYENSAKKPEDVITPFAVIRDDDYQSIVITIRGTSDLSDVVIDAVAHPHSVWDEIPDANKNKLGENSNWKQFTGKVTKKIISISIYNIGIFHTNV